MISAPGNSRISALKSAGYGFPLVQVFVTRPMLTFSVLLTTDHENLIPARSRADRPHVHTAQRGVGRAFELEWSLIIERTKEGLGKEEKAYQGRRSGRSLNAPLRRRRPSAARARSAYVGRSRTCRRSSAAAAWEGTQLA